MNNKPRPVAHFVTTIVSDGGDRRFLKHYIVVATTTSRAISLIPKREGEVVMEAREARDYQLIVDRLKK